MIKFKLPIIVLTLLIAFNCSIAFAQRDVSPILDRGDFGPFKRSLNIKPHGYALIKDTAANAPAKYLERFEVRPGDCHANRGINDCRKDRERSELSEKGKRSQRGSTAWYGWDFYLGDDWPDVWPTKTVIGQFHQVKAHPVWMFLHYKGALVLDDHSRGKSRQKVELINADQLRGKWHRIEVQAKWATDDSGFFNVWVDGKEKFQMSGPTMTASAVYFKYGVYRAFVSRYIKATGKPRVPAQTAHFANVKKAKSRHGLTKNDAQR